MDGFSLTAEQQAAATDLGGSILLLAPAGTGKTETIARRIAHIIAADAARPPEILCLTFTNQAAKELSERVCDILAAHTDGAERQINIGTFHRFCADILRADPFSPFARDKHLAILDDGDSAEILLALAGDVLGDVPHSAELGRVLYYFTEQVKKRRTALTLFSDDEPADWRRTLADLRDDPAPITAVCKNNLRDFLISPPRLAEMLLAHGERLMKRYAAALRAAHGLDFNDLIMYAARFLADDANARRLGEGYKFIIIDEVQDTSPAEYNLIRRLFRGQSVMLAGDVAQTIYKWRGSAPELVIAAFKTDCAPVRTIALRENHRSTALLIAAGQAFYQGYFGKNALADIACLPEPTPADPRIRLARPGDETGEAAAILDVLRAMTIEERKSAGILVRTNRYAARLSDALRAAQSALPPEAGRIDFLLAEDNDFFRRAEIKDVLAVARFLLNPYDSRSFRRIVGAFPGFGAGERTFAALVTAEAKAVGVSPADAARPLPETGDPYQSLIDALPRRRIVVFDVESTGVDTTRDEIVQVAAIRLAPDGSIGEKFVRFLRPARPVGTSVHVHHFSDEFLAANGEDPAAVLEELALWLGDAVIIGHNVGYDLAIMTSQRERLGLDALGARPVFDTLDIYRRFRPELANHKLATIGAAVKVSHPSDHDAYNDICATGEILVYALKNYILPTAAARREIMAAVHPRFDRLRQWLDGLREKLAADCRPHRLITDIIMERQLPQRYAAEAAALDEKAAAAQGQRRRKYEQEAATARTRIENLRELIRQFRDWDEPIPAADSLTRLLALAALNKTELSLRQKERAAVPVITVHRSKGMEFDTVFLAGLTENEFPGYGAIKSDTVEQEASLFYVAMTRAKRQLFISAPQAVRNHPANPSRFIGLIPGRYLAGTENFPR